MNCFEQIKLYGSAPCWSMRGKSKKALEQALNMRIHPKKRNRRRDPGASTRCQSKASKPLGEVGQNVQGYNSWEEAIRDAQTSSGRVVTKRRSLPTNPVFLKKSDASKAEAGPTL